MSEETTAPELKVGMELKGTVTNIELYGAFVNIGTEQDALLHISQLGKSNVRNVEDIVKVGEEITVYILKIHKDAGRIALTLVKPPELAWNDIKEGQTYTGKVVKIEKFGVFVDIGAERPGMVHVSELAEGFVQQPSDVVSNGQEVPVRILKVNRKKRQIDLSMKPEPEPVEEVVVEDDDDEPMPTAMELAFRKAQARQKAIEDTVSKTNAKNKKRRSEQQDDIIARTLRNHSS